MLKMPSPEELAAMAAAQPQAVQVAAPINDVQVVVMAAAEIYHGHAGVTSPKQAVEVARQMFVEAVVAEQRHSLVAEIRERLQPSERTKAGEQFVLPGTR